MRALFLIAAFGLALAGCMGEDKKEVAVSICKETYADKASCEADEKCRWGMNDGVQFCKAK